jgi:thymidylate synthase
MHADYEGQGVDQLADVINKIRNSPNDRRIVLSAWNPAALRDMALPPCHMFCQVPPSYTPIATLDSALAVPSEWMGGNSADCFS